VGGVTIYVLIIYLHVQHLRCYLFSSDLYVRLSHDKCESCMSESHMDGSCHIMSCQALVLARNVSLLSPLTI